jgi:hypothetical protein
MTLITSARTGSHRNYRKSKSDIQLTQVTGPKSLTLSRRAKRNVRSQKDRLCTRCAKINLDAVFSKPHPSYRGNLVKNLGPIARWPIDLCSFCRLLATTLPPLERKYPGVSYSLRSSSSKRTMHMGWKSIDTVMLWLEGRRRYRNPNPVFLVPQPEGVNTIRILKRDSIDFGILTSWLHLCQDMHTKTCTVKKSSVPFLKLIDCERRVIVPALDHSYVTLSYMWGSASGSIEYSEILPEDLPCTIEDAVTVTRQVGFRYLWVDRYCINQQCEEEVSTHVRKMDLIYQNSEVTVIAVAGQDPSYGLPGVGRRHRSKQACANIGKHFLVSALEDPKSWIENSTWITRAWTYQEALLSRRRLVFTVQQVYYECLGMYCCEALNFPVQDLHVKNLQCFQKPHCNGQNIGAFPRGVGTSPWEVIRRIEEYSQKSLTNPSDILNGMLGIFRAFETNVHGIHHCWGVPVLPQPPKMAQPTAEKRKSFQWSPTMGFLLGLCWNLKESSTRRPGFPSWSWTGWFGSMRWPNVAFSQEWWKSDWWGSLQTNPEVKIRLELRDRETRDFDTFQRSYEDLNQQSELSNFIHISAWTTPIHIIGYNRRYSDKPIEWEARVDLEDGGYLRWRFHPTTNKNLVNDSCTGIHLFPGTPEKADGPTGPALMVVCMVGDRMERVGFSWIDQTTYKIYGPDNVGEYAGMDVPLWANPIYAQRPRLVMSWQELRLG